MSRKKTYAGRRKAWYQRLWEDWFVFSWLGWIILALLIVAALSVLIWYLYTPTHSKAPNAAVPDPTSPATAATQELSGNNTPTPIPTLTGPPAAITPAPTPEPEPEFTLGYNRGELTLLKWGKGVYDIWQEERHSEGRGLLELVVQDGETQKTIIARLGTPEGEGYYGTNPPDLDQFLGQDRTENAMQLVTDAEGYLVLLRFSGANAGVFYGRDTITPYFGEVELHDWWVKRGNIVYLEITPGGERGVRQVLITPLTTSNSVCSQSIGDLEEWLEGMDEREGGILYVAIGEESGLNTLDYFRDGTHDLFTCGFSIQ
ncbi:hypothetical protein KJ596_00280 [Patescibacteria group bacterium]|nr:hypothetical protein [Patescibacteria group bacterium]